MKLSILGSEWEVVTKKDNESRKLRDNDGLCEFYTHQIVLCDREPDDMSFDNIDEYNKQVLRHEIVHAYFAESGLRGNSEYAENEELVDWIAIQIPKMVKTMQEAKCL